MADKAGSSSGEVHTEAVYVISVAAELAGMHAQTLRSYDRIGLVSPARTTGGGRRYSDEDVAKLQKIQHLSQEEGVNLAGIRAIIDLDRENKELRKENARLRAENNRLHAGEGQTTSPRRGELVHVPRSTALVAWQPVRRRHRRST